MQNLSLILPFLLFWFGYPASDSPHGKDFQLNCNVCHSSKGWEFDKKNYSFDHSKTAFMLTGQHVETTCRACHPSLIFSEAKTACVSCHADRHNETARLECSKCHTPKSWIITNATQIHQQGRFPLLGAHATADCYSCHKSGSLLRFEAIGVECNDCHQSKYASTSKPNHISAGFSTNCYECHKVTSFEWSGNFNHTKFPLTYGHENVKCIKCHTSGVFGSISSDCNNCHHSNYTATTDPNHVTSNFPTTCLLCHTTVGWSPANFNHNTTNFPLTGQHVGVACIKCHTNGYAGTPTACESCHMTKYTATTNPNHSAAGIGTSCSTCHTPAGWQPALFPNHNSVYVIAGFHTTLSCSACHINNNYTTTPTTCVGCHLTNYNQTTNPNHSSAQFPTNCANCHSQNSWTPATFNHDPWFPIYSGKHKNQWSHCSDCHTNSSNYTVFTCTTSCHPQSSTNGNHGGVSGYSYNSTACYSCHPNGSAKKSVSPNQKHFK